MRKVGLFLPVAAFLFLAFPAAPRSAAGEAGSPGASSGEAPAKTGFSTRPPEKKFDLKNLDLTKPPSGSVASPGPGDQTEKPKPKPLVKYQSVNLVPEGAGAVIELPDATRLARMAGGSPFGRLMGDERLGPVWQRHIIGRARLAPPLAEGLPNGDVLVDAVYRLSEIVAGQAVLALFPGGEGEAGPRLLLVAEVDDAHRAAFIEAVEELKAKAGLGHDAVIERVIKGDFELQNVRNTKSNLNLTWGLIGNQLAIEIGIDRAKPGARLLEDKVLKAALSGGEKSLARESARVEERRVLSKDLDADLYVRIDPRALAGLYGQGAAPASLEGVRYIAAAVAFSPRAARERIFVALEPEGRLNKLLSQTGPAEGLGRLMPLNAVAYETERLESGAAAKMFEAFKASLPEGAPRKLLEERIKNLEEKSGLSFENDVLGALAGDLASAVVINSAAPGAEPEFIMALQAKDLEKARKALEGLERVGGATFKDDLSLGRIRYLDEPPGALDPRRARTGQAGGVSGLPFFGVGQAGGGRGSPEWLEKGPLAYFKAYAFSGDCVILGTSLRVVKLAIRQKDASQHASSILDKPDFKEARAALGTAPGEIASGYLDLRRFGEAAYAQYGSARLADLPPADKVLDEVGGLAWSDRRETGGVSADVASSIGILPLTGAMAIQGWLDGLDRAAAAEARAHAYKLKTVWRGMELFATEFGRYPVNLSELYPAYVQDASAFLTPAQERLPAADRPVIAKSEEVEAKSGYKYVSGRLPGSAGGSIVIYSEKPAPGGEHWCLRVNGRVDKVSAKTLAEALAGSRTTAASK